MYNIYDIVYIVICRYNTDRVCNFRGVHALVKQSAKKVK